MQPYPPQWPVVTVQQPPTSTLAVMSLISGILGLLAGCCTFGFFSIIAVILGHFALSEIKKTGERGDGMAKAGLYLGYILVVPMALWSFYLVLSAAGA